jgi:multidrug/hemolysin transport system permease protein
MKTLIKRNMKLYFRDKANIFFSMLAILIIIALFALFLGEGFNVGSDDILRTWLMAGVLSVAAITTTIGSFEIIISDRVNKTAKGFYASPVKRSHITASYILSPFIAGVLMSTLTAIGFGIYIVARGGEMPGFVGLVQLFGLILLSNLTGSAILCFVVSLIKTLSAWNTIGSIIGIMSGFLMGVYMPVGNLPSAVQYTMVAFPPFHSAMLFRQILMEIPVETAYLASAGELDVVQLHEVLGVFFRFGDFTVTPFVSVVYLIVSGLFFYGLSVINMHKLGKM